MSIKFPHDFSVKRNNQVKSFNKLNFPVRKDLSHGMSQ
uniref:Uncharacterized protein n=1 Tax=Rhizophora mucronata TaxID=61149 RepID=A0A2P2IVP2_RHIMU